MKDLRTSVEVRPASTWIERFGLPLAVSAMEAQPIALVIGLLTLAVTRNLANAPIGAGGIALVALGLLWWAMIVERTSQRSPGRRRAAGLHFLGWLTAFTLVVGPRLPSLIAGENIFAALLGTVIVTWLWRRSIPRAQAGFEYGQLTTSFRVGFGVLLGILLIAVVLPGQQALRDALASSLPIFFLSGLVGLSLVRLGAIRTSRRALDGSQQADPTRAWLLALTLFGVALIALVLVLEAVFSFGSFELAVTALTPLWSALGTLVGWLLYGSIFLLSPIFYLFSFLIGLIMNRNAKTPAQNTAQKLSHFHQQLSPQSIPPEALAIGRWMFLALALLVVLLVVGGSLRRLRKRSADEGIEEVREGLDARSLLGERWQEWWNHRRRRRNAHLPLEPLDPTSARARYRELLQALATASDDLARGSAETPAEYEARLLTHLGKGTPPVQDLAHDDDAPHPAILDKLTRAYAGERYGGKRTDHRTHVYLQTWVPRLMQRLTGKAPARSNRSKGSR
jgi:MFS family permease